MRDGEGKQYEPEFVVQKHQTGFKIKDNGERIKKSQRKIYIYEHQYFSLTKTVATRWHAMYH